MPGFFSDEGYKARRDKLKRNEALISYQQNTIKHRFYEILDQYNDENPCCCSCCAFYPSIESTSSQLRQSLNAYENCKATAYKFETCATFMGIGTVSFGVAGAGCWICCACCCGCSSLTMLGQCLGAFAGTGLFLGGLLATGANCNRSNDDQIRRINDFLPAFQRLSTPHRRLSISKEHIAHELKAISHGTDHERQLAINNALPSNFHSDLFAIIHQYQAETDKNRKAAPDAPEMLV